MASRDGISYFNPRSRKGSDSTCCTSIDVASLFQSTLPQGERPVRNGRWFSFTQFQSTLPQGERQWKRSYWRCKWRISIHAPARGATTITLGVTDNNDNFNPRSRKGSDGRLSEIGSCCCYFNPRSRKGSDLIRWMERTVLMNFNPRSRKGSDGKRRKSIDTSAYFNPRSRKGSDLIVFPRIICIWVFQSTLPQGERLFPTL